MVTPNKKLQRKMILDVRDLGSIVDPWAIHEPQTVKSELPGRKEPWLSLNSGPMK